MFGDHNNIPAQHATEAQETNPKKPRDPNERLAIAIQKFNDFLKEANLEENLNHYKELKLLTPEEANTYNQAYHAILNRETKTEMEYIQKRADLVLLVNDINTTAKNLTKEEIEAILANLQAVPRIDPTTTTQEVMDLLKSRQKKLRFFIETIYLGYDADVIKLNKEYAAMINIMNQAVKKINAVPNNAKHLEKSIQAQEKIKTQMEAISKKIDDYTEKYQRIKDIPINDYTFKKSDINFHQYNQMLLAIATMYGNAMRAYGFDKYSNKKLADLSVMENQIEPLFPGLNGRYDQETEQFATNFKTGNEQKSLSEIINYIQECANKSSELRNLENNNNNKKNFVDAALDQVKKTVMGLTKQPMDYVFDAYNELEPSHPVRKLLIITKDEKTKEYAVMVDRSYFDQNVKNYFQIKELTGDKSALATELEAPNKDRLDLGNDIMSLQAEIKDFNMLLDEEIKIVQQAQPAADATQDQENNNVNIQTNFSQFQPKNTHTAQLNSKEEIAALFKIVHDQRIKIATKENIFHSHEIIQTKLETIDSYLREINAGEKIDLISLIQRLKEDDCFKKPENRIQRTLKNLDVFSLFKKESKFVNKLNQFCKNNKILIKTGQQNNQQPELANKPNGPNKSGD